MLEQEQMSEEQLIYSIKAKESQIYEAKCLVEKQKHLLSLKEFKVNAIACGR